MFQGYSKPENLGVNQRELEIKNRWFIKVEAMYSDDDIPPKWTLRRPVAPKSLWLGKGKNNIGQD